MKTTMTNTPTDFVLDGLSEPLLRFAHSQLMADPREGLALFGPLDEGKPHGVRMGIVGTEQGIKRVTDYVHRLQTPIFPLKTKRNRPVYPGFEAAFGIPWNPKPYLVAKIDPLKLHTVAHQEDKHQRVFDTASLYADAIIEQRREGESQVDIWLVVVPDFVWVNCRPRSMIAKALRTDTKKAIGLSEAKRRQEEPVLDFAEWRGDDVAYQYDPDFHHQLKGRLLEKEIPTQIVRESTIAWRDVKKANGKYLHDLSVLESQIAWNMSSAVFYKSGGKPWNLAAARKGVCYLGIVFKQLEREKDEKTACCAAQMFLNSGDGVVFKGDVGPWFNPKRGEFHLDKAAAQQLVSIAINSYSLTNGGPPAELFIHGRTYFSDEEWEGFREAGGENTKVSGIRIALDKDLRLYHNSKNPVLRGTAFRLNDRKGILWTKGWVPRLQTYPGGEVPVPLRIEVVRGEADLRVVMEDILALTKLNYNGCQFADGMPVTLRFAEAVGEILISGPRGPVPPLSFRYYI